MLKLSERRISVCGSLREPIDTRFGHYTNAELVYDRAKRTIAAVLGEAWDSKGFAVGVYPYAVYRDVEYPPDFKFYARKLGISLR